MKNYYIIFVVSLFFVFSVWAGMCKVEPDFKSYNSAKVKGAASKAKNPVAGLKFITVDQAAKFAKDNANYIFIDTRPAMLNKQCHIKNSVNLEYTFAGAAGEKKYNSSTPKLTKEAAKKYIDEGKTLVFYCNSMKCHRSVNAAIQCVCGWGLPESKVMWFGHGVPGLAKKKKRLVKGTNCSF
jgi:rhodanese-related sulfurtransferase